MKLDAFRVREFRSIWDSECIHIDGRTTCLVGKNESGKTALLTALYRTNPFIAADAKFDAVYDYPKREVQEYRADVKDNSRKPTIVVETKYSLDSDEKEMICEKFGPNVLQNDRLTHRVSYGSCEGSFVLNVDEKAAQMYLANNKNLPGDLKDCLQTAENWTDFAKAIESAEHSSTAEELKQLVRGVTELGGLSQYITKTMLLPRMPKFLYFDEYYQLSGCANLNSLIDRELNDQLQSSDHPLLGLLNLGHLDYKSLIENNSTMELKNQIEGAGNHLTRTIMKHCSQNKHIQMRFDVRDARRGDPPGMQNGINLWSEIYDSVHWVNTPLGSRSRGFIWFFSFLAWYEDLKRKNSNLILLLDEPGLSLHGRAQGDLLKYFDTELSIHQIIYTTHSPFMIDPNRFKSVRIVQDLGIDNTQQLPKEEDGTKVLEDVLDATNDSLFPLQAALGYEVQQTLFVGPNILIVEGVSDMLYLSTISQELRREERSGLSDKWVITPVGGIGRVTAFVALLAPQSGIKLATLLDIQDSDQTLVENLYKRKLLVRQNVHTFANFTTQREADIEDLFEREFFLDLFNREHKKELNSPIKMKDLNADVPRILSAMRSALDDRFGRSSFNHYRPARYLQENIGSLWGEITNQTKDRFEMLFKEINSLLD